MKSPRILIVIAILSVLALEGNTVLVNADASANTTSIDFGQTNFYSPTNNGTFASINVKANIETEPNGHWIVNKTYQVSLLISITYVNESVYNPNFFTIECYRNGYPISVEDAILSPLTNNVIVTPQSNGTMLMTVRPLVVKDTGLYFNFAVTFYYNNSIVTNGSWTQGLKNTPPIPITVDDRFSTPTTPEFPAILIVPLLLSVLLVAVILRHRKTANLNQ
jgi:hypothetical protein